MNEFKRYGINNECAFLKSLKQVFFIFLTFCAGSVSESVKTQVHGALYDMALRK